MSSQTASSSTFSATCRNCGGRVSRPVSFCPHCGANAMLAFPNAKSWTKNERADVPLGDAIRPPRPVPLFMPAGAAAHGGGGSSASAATYGGNARQWGLKTGTGVTLLMFVVLVGGSILLSQQSDKTEQHSRDVLMHTVVGAVAPGAEDHAHVTPPATKNAPAQHQAPAPQALAMTAPAPSQQAAAAPLTSPQPAPAPQPSATAHVAAAPAPEPTAPPQVATAPAPTQTATAPAQPASVPHPPTTTAFAAQTPQAPSPAWRLKANPAPAPAPSQPTYASTRARTPPAPVPSARESRDSQRRAAVPHELAVAWSSLQKNDLKGAQGSLDRALAADPNNSEAFMLRQDLMSREQSRDDALIAARGCAAQHQWRCAWHNAGKALAIDSSSAEAKAMVQRSIVDSGAIDMPAGPGPDMPDGPVMPPGYH
jgi:hypothetical protein